MKVLLLEDELTTEQKNKEADVMSTSFKSFI